MSYDYSKISVKEIEEILPKLSRQQIMELDQRIMNVFRNFSPDQSLRDRIL